MILVFDVMGVALRLTGFNQPLLDMLAGYRARGIKVYFASNMGKAEKKRFWPRLAPAAEALYCSEELGFNKPHVDFYRKFEVILGIVPSQIIFFDDSQANIDAAKAAGWQAFLYHDVVRTREQIEESIK